MIDLRNIPAMYVGNKPVKQIWLGDKLIRDFAPVIEPPEEPAPFTLKSFDFKPGFAVKSAYISTNRQPQMGLVLQHAKRITAESEFKFHSIQKIEGEFNFTGADIVANYARANGLRVHGHPIVWIQGPEANLAWLNAYANNPTGLLVVLENHIKTVVQRYDDVVDSWDGVNEPLNNGGGSYKTGVWYTAFGADYIHHVVRLIRKYAKSTAKIFINEYDQQSNGGKVTSLLRIADELAAAGNPIDGIGYQMHTSPNINLTQYRDSLRRFVAKGLLIHVSELDVKSWVGESLPWPDYYTPTKEASVALLWKNIYRITQEEVPLHKLWGITIWSVTDLENFENQQPGVGFLGNIVLFLTGGVKSANYHSVMSLLPGYVPS